GRTPWWPRPPDPWRPCIAGSVLRAVRGWSGLPRVRLLGYGPGHATGDDRDGRCAAAVGGGVRWWKRQRRDHVDHHASGDNDDRGCRGRPARRGRGRPERVWGPG